MKREFVKKGSDYGVCPAIVLNSPKYPHNVGAVLRAASCYSYLGVRQVFFTGNRVMQALGDKKRMPREERMRAYDTIELINTDYPLDMFSNAVPVAIELLPGSVPLFQFEHPKNAVYIFGPEDGNVHPGFRAKCHHFIYIPTLQCLNLSAAVYTVLYDRAYKEFLKTGVSVPNACMTRHNEQLEEDFSFMRV
jgi:tRNA(Leu) C34 or U34 (ribose-2'-O)-methylase TrmL